MKLTFAALTATLAIVPAAHATDTVLRCDFPDGGGSDVYVIAGKTARVDPAAGAPLGYQQVEETSTQFKLSGNAGEPDTTVAINRVTGVIVINGKARSGSLIAIVGQCVLANAKF